MYATQVSDPEYLARFSVSLTAAMFYRGLEPIELAARLEVNKYTIYRWMNGQHGPSAAEAARIAKVLDAPGYLFIRPAETRERALAMMGAYDALRARGDESRPGPSRP